MTIPRDHLDDFSAYQSKKSVVDLVHIFKCTCTNVHVNNLVVSNQSKSSSNASQMRSKQFLVGRVGGK